MYSIRADPRLSLVRRVLACKNKKKGKNRVNGGGESERGHVREGRKKRTNRGKLCQTRLSIPRVVIVIVVTAVGATVQKLTRLPFSPDPLTATRSLSPYERSVREIGDLFSALSGA